MTSPWRRWSKRALYERIGEITESYERQLREMANENLRLTQALEFYASKQNEQINKAAREALHDVYGTHLCQPVPGAKVFDA